MSAHADLIVVAVPPGWAKQITKDLAAIKRELGIIEHEEEQIMTDQEHVDAEVQAIGAVVTDLGAATANIQAELDALKQAHPAVDFTALDAAVASLQGAQAGVDALETPADTAPEV